MEYFIPNSHLAISGRIDLCRIGPGRPDAGLQAREAPVGDPAPLLQADVTRVKVAEGLI